MDGLTAFAMTEYANPWMPACTSMTGYRTQTILENESCRRLMDVRYKPIRHMTTGVPA